MKIICKNRWLMASFDVPQMVLSWAIHGGGRRAAQNIVWHQVEDQELNLFVDAKDFLKQALFENRIEDAVGMLTSADLNFYAHVEKSDSGISANCVATVEMSNALRIGDAPRDIYPIGTINLLCAVSVPMSEEAHFEALSLAVEARTAAVLEAGIASLESNLLATGTGTDCVVMATSLKPNAGEAIVNYSGKHTLIGSLVGKSVFEAVSLGLKQWKNQQLSQHKQPDQKVCV